MYLGFDSEGWEHHTFKVDVKNKTVKPQAMCDFCKAAFWEGEQLDEFRNKMQQAIQADANQRGAHNPRLGCP